MPLNIHLKNSHWNGLSKEFLSFKINLFSWFTYAYYEMSQLL